METNNLKLNNLLSLILHTFKKTTQLFTEVKSGEFIATVHPKGENDKFTDADYVVQKMFENYLFKYFPKMKFVGEEDTSKEVVKESKYYEIDTEINFNLIKDSAIDGEVTEEFCIYMDPIDSTEQFIKKNYIPVTCLVGITKNSKPYVGFIHFPYYKGEENNSLTFFNLPSHGIFCYNTNTDEIIKMPCENREVEEFTFVTSRTRTTQKMKDVMALFENSKSTFASGLGNKSLAVVLEDSIYISGGKGIITLT